MTIVKMSMVALAAVAGLSASALGQGAATWTFETSQPVNTGPHEAELGANASGSEATTSHAGNTVVSSPAGNGSARSFSSTVWAVGDYYMFQLSTIGFSNLQVQWDQTSSNTGPRDFTLSYSLNGVSFTNLTDYSVLANASPAWNSATRSPLYQLGPFALPASLDNQPVIFLRLTMRTTVSANGGTVASGGTDRVDNFSVPTPGAAALLGLGGLVAGRRRRA